MTSNDILYKVKADNGLGGTVFGRDAADELAARLGSRPDVVSVEAEPLSRATDTQTGERVYVHALGLRFGRALVSRGPRSRTYHVKAASLTGEQS